MPPNSSPRYIDMEHRRLLSLDYINQLRYATLTGNLQDLQNLKNEYNRLIDDMNDAILAAPRDIFDVFPPEVWTQIVKDALPSRGYSSGLLLLTTVSQKWQQQLISASTLWRTIELHGSEEDLLATIETFVQLSSDLPLHLYIYIATYHDAAMISPILTSIGSRLSEVTIRGAFFLEQEELSVLQLSVLQLLLKSIAYSSSLTRIHLEDGDRYPPLYDSAIAQMISNSPLLLSVRAIRGWQFMWRDFVTSAEYLNHVEAIDSRTPIDDVIPSQDLPKLKVLQIDGGHSKSNNHATLRQEGVPQLGSLTTLTYYGAFGEGLLQLLLSVAPQLSYLELNFPCIKLPLLPSVLQAATSLRRLSLLVYSTNVDDLNTGPSTSLDFPPITTCVSCLREIIFKILPGDHWPVPKFGDKVLSNLLNAFSELYREVEVMELIMDVRCPESIIAALDYASDLPKLRTLGWPDTMKSFTVVKPRELQALEYLNTGGPLLVGGDAGGMMSFGPNAGGTVLLGSLLTPKLLSLKFIWRNQGVTERQKYENVRKLFLICDTIGQSTIEFPANSFPRLQELTIHLDTFDTPSYHDTLQLNSFQFQFLSSITIRTNPYAPHETILCFALLHQPEKCPALNEIRFRGWPPDWDGLFLMLEKRNFMANSSVSRIRRIVLPFLPPELRAPLASLLRGRYTERPSNEELLMGGAQELILDEKIPGCLMCLVCMRSGCKTVVRFKGSGGGIDNFMKIRRNCSPDFQYPDPAVLEWITQRKALLDRFASKLNIWESTYQRGVWCDRKTVKMEITEYGC